MSQSYQRYAAAARQMCKLNRQTHLTSEHVLLAFTKLDRSFQEALAAKNCKHTSLERELADFLSRNCPKTEEYTEPINAIIIDEIEEAEPASIYDFFILLLEYQQTYSKYLLDKYKLDEAFFNSLRDKTLSEIISKYTTNYTQIAHNFDPLIGRGRELDLLILTLSRRKKSNPILVGDSGVGKTAIVEGLARRVAKGEVPASLRGVSIFALELTNLIAGTRFRGDFEKRMKDLLSELVNHERAIVFIDEIHMAIGAGAAGESSMDVSNILKPYLSSGKLRCIGATTLAEYKKIEKQQAFSRRFSKILVAEPSKDECVNILQGLKSQYEQYHKVFLGEHILTLCPDLAKRYISDRSLPDSALDLMDEVAAFCSLDSREIATQEDLEAVLAKITHRPVNLDEKAALLGLSQRLNKHILGQDEVLQKLCSTLMASFFGFREENKPRAVLLFTGASGVGKSELAKQLANELGMGFCRFDMSEFKDEHSSSKLIGAPAGFVGYEEGGLLSKEIRAKPFSVVLLDEIEKAHPSICNLFLQVFDNASIKSADGFTLDFQHSIIILSSNLGLKDPNSMGFIKDKNARLDLALDDFFSPEFLNRIDKILHFKALSRSVLEELVHKELKERLKDIELSISSSVMSFLLDRVRDENLGARLLKRVLSKHIYEPLAELLLRNKDAKDKKSFALQLKAGQIVFLTKNGCGKSKTKAKLEPKTAKDKPKDNPKDKLKDESSETLTQGQI